MPELLQRLQTVWSGDGKTVLLGIVAWVVATGNIAVGTVSWRNSSFILSRCPCSGELRRCGVQGNGLRVPVPGKCAFVLYRDSAAAVFLSL